MGGAYAAGVYAGPCEPCSTCIFPPEIAVHVHLSCPSVVMISSRHNNNRATPVARRLLRTHRHRPSRCAPTARFAIGFLPLSISARSPVRARPRCTLFNAHARTHGPLCPFRRLATYSTALSVHSRSFGCWGVQFPRGAQDSISNIITNESVERWTQALLHGCPRPHPPCIMMCCVSERKCSSISRWQSGGAYLRTGVANHPPQHRVHSPASI